MPGEVVAAVATVTLVLPEPPELRVAFAGFTVAVNPEPETEAVRVTLPLNPFRLVSVIVELVDELS
jgi:hypothetical protein